MKRLVKVRRKIVIFLAFSGKEQHYWYAGLFGEIKADLYSLQLLVLLLIFLS